MNLAQLQAMLAASGLTVVPIGSGAVSATVPAKPARSLTFRSYISGEKAPATLAQFKAAVATGVEAGSLYAHGSAARHAVSAQTVREILTAIGAALA